MADHYIEIIEDFLTPIRTRIWKRIDDENIRCTSDSLGSQAKIVEFETIYKASKLYPLHLTPGEYFPRMSRPFAELIYIDCEFPYHESPGINPEDGDSIQRIRAISTGQLHALILQLESICRVVHPEKENLKAYGHETRNLLILAGTEVEGQCKGIFEANGRTEKPRKDHYKLLSGVMKLPEYKVRLNYYPWLPEVSPFDDMGWYDAYNEVKHARESRFHRATLRNAIRAVAACFVLICSQHGWRFALSDIEGERAFFQLVGKPAWHPSDLYVPESPAVPRYYEFTDWPKRPAKHPLVFD